MNKLKEAVTQMEQARSGAAMAEDHIRALRHWRLQAERRFLGVVVKAAELKQTKVRK